MEIKQIAPWLWMVRKSEPALRRYTGSGISEHGFQYNTWLADTGAGLMALGAMPPRHVEEWVSALRRITDGQVKYAVFFGTDDDRASAKALLGAFPDCTVIAGEKTLFQLEQMLGPMKNPVKVRSDRSLTMGAKRFNFRVLKNRGAFPCLYVVDQTDGVLFTADASGSFYAGEDKSIRMVCPSLGPVVDNRADIPLGADRPSEVQKGERPSVALAYTGSGYTSELAENIASGIRQAGDLTILCVDLSAMDWDEALRQIKAADAWLFGTADVDGDAEKSLWDIVTSLTARDAKGKRAALFLSCTVRGRAAENIRERLKQIGCSLDLEDFTLQGVMDRASVERTLEYGYAVGCAILKIPNPRKPKLVKCLVCGEVFDASLGTCPVCGVGLEQCVPVEEDTASFYKNSSTRYVILGGGIAALSAAEAIRLRDRTGSILLISAENHLPINRPMLTKDIFLAAQGSESLFVHPPEWYEERGLSLKLGVSVTGVDLQEKSVLTDRGESIPYDKLIFATGAECFIPPIPGSEKRGVITIRHLTDSVALAERLRTAGRAVVIGGGVLGLEAANELVRAGLHVTVLEATPQIIGRQVDDKTAALIRNAMGRMGVDCLEGVSIAAVEGETQVSGVRLSDGRVFPAGLVVVSCGNRANIQAARNAGIQTQRGIVVNQYMETSVADIYACGDCAEFDGVNYQLWQEASGQGKTAGANAAGDCLTYANEPLGLSLEGFGTPLFAIGDPGKRTDIPYKTVELCDRVSNRYEKYWYYGGSLEGAVLIGAPGQTAKVTQAVRCHARYGEM